MSKKYLNPNFRQQAPSYEEVNLELLVSRLTQGHTPSLSAAITIIESDRTADREKARKILQLLPPCKYNTLRIAISGSPGVGKSTFIEAIASERPEAKIAVLSVDPSSSQSGGSILGDKTRMESLVDRKNAFIRPSAAGKTLGGVHAKTKETILLCEAAGYEYIVVETVGVGQSETSVSAMVDLFMLLILPGSGDELQGIKRGIVELADMIIISKADKERRKLAISSERSYKNANHLFRAKHADWVVPVFSVSALEKYNLHKVWADIDRFWAFAQKEFWLKSHRGNQNLQWYDSALRAEVISKFLKDPSHQKLLDQHTSKISDGEQNIWNLILEFWKNQP